MDYGLPTSVTIGEAVFPIRYDYRVVLDTFEVVNDPDLSDEEKALAILQIFYPDYEQITDYAAAMEQWSIFINGGKAEKKDSGRGKLQLVSWTDDFPYIISAVNRIIGHELRAIPYDLENNTGGVHWWTFLSAFYEIGDCFFAQIVSIRNKRAKGKKLDKQEQEFYRNNRDVIDIKMRYSEADMEAFAQWGIK